jgi:hypothetical protein
MVMPSTPATAMMSPNVVSVISVRLRPEKENSLVIFRLVKGAVELGDGNVFAGKHASVEDAGDREASEVVAVVEIRDQDLQRASDVTLGGGDGFKDCVEQRAQVLAGNFNVGR